MKHEPYLSGQDFPLDVPEESPEFKQWKRGRRALQERHHKVLRQQVLSGLVPKWGLVSVLTSHYEHERGVADVSEVYAHPALCPQPLIQIVANPHDLLTPDEALEASDRLPMAWETVALTLRDIFLRVKNRDFYAERSLQLCAEGKAFSPRIMWHKASKAKPIN